MEETDCASKCKKGDDDCLKECLAFKKYSMWTKEEDNILKNHYLDNVGKKVGKNFPHFKYLQNRLKEKGFIRSYSSVARRFHLIGLKYYSTTQTEIKTECSDCGTDIIVFGRYANRKTNKQTRCIDCQDIRDRKYERENKDRVKVYHKNYLRTWRKHDTHRS